MKDDELEKIYDGLHYADRGRSRMYAEDLNDGLRMLRTFAQGVTIFGSARIAENDKYYEMARRLGQGLARRGHTVITGGGPGIMEAANRGAYEYGGRSVGLNITLEHEQFPNAYLTDVMQFRYFFARKVMLAMSGKTYVFFPGGFGTMDELSEILILMQEGKMPKMPVFLIGKSFWRPLDKFFESRMQAKKYVKPGDRRIYKITDDINDVIAAADKVGHVRVDESFYDGFSGH